MTAAWCVADGVLEQVAERLLDALRVDLHLLVGSSKVDRHARGARQRFDGLDAPSEQVRDGGRHATDGDPANARSGQDEEVLGQSLEPPDVPECSAQRHLELRGRPIAGQRQLDLGAQRRQRRPEFVTGVIDEAVVAFHRLLEAVEHRVEGRRQAGELVARPRDGEPTVEIRGGDGFGFAAVRLTGLDDACRGSFLCRADNSVWGQGRQRASNRSLPHDS
jgi:hypothetical protein